MEPLLDMLFLYFSLWIAVHQEHVPTSPEAMKSLFFNHYASYGRETAFSHSLPLRICLLPKLSIIRTLQVWAQVFFSLQDGVHQVELLGPRVGRILPHVPSQAHSPQTLHKNI